MKGLMEFVEILAASGAERPEVLEVRHRLMNRLMVIILWFGFPAVLKTDSTNLDDPVRGWIQTGCFQIEDHKIVETQFF